MLPLLGHGYRGGPIHRKATGMGGTGRWRRWFLAGPVVLALTLAGCATPRGIDGDLTNSWPVFAEAKTPVPVAGVCSSRAFDTVWAGPFESLDCTSGPHQTETSYVGTFTGVDANRSSPPAAGSPGRRTAYQTCQQRSAQYLGGDVQAALVYLGLTLPTSLAWTGGARWYRCELLHFSDPDDDTPVTTGSVRNGLTGARPLAIGCINVTDNGSQYVSDLSDNVDCATAHSAEYAGFYTAPDLPWNSDQAARDKAAGAGCETIVAHYLGFTGNALRNPVVGIVYDTFDQKRWELGDRSIRCYAYAYTKSKKMIGSVKGIGAKVPKS